MSGKSEQVEAAETVVTAVDEIRLPQAGAAAPKKIVVLSLIHRPPLRLLNYVESLVGRGDEVHAFVSKVELWEEAELEHRPHLHPLDQPEDQLLVRRVERAIVFRAPKAVAAAAGKVAGPRSAELISRAQGKVSGAVHKRLFMPPYRAFRPRLLAKRFDAGLRAIDFDTVDLVVAADVYTVTLAARLARQHPNVRVTTALEL